MRYLDYAASCPMRPDIAKQYLSDSQRYFANPHGGTCFAEECRRIILAAEKKLLHCLDGKTHRARVIWCSGGTEALNLAISGLAAKYKIAACGYDPTAHPAMLEPLKKLRNAGTALSPMPVEQSGMLKLEESKVERINLFCCSQVNNETGQIQPLTQLRQKMGANCLFCVDAAQSFTKIPIPWEEARIDLAVLSARKIGGPPSIAALLCRDNIDLAPLFVGGGQQNGLRSGSLDTVAISMFAKSAQLACQKRAEEAARLFELKQFLRDGIEALSKGKWPVFSGPQSIPDIFSFAIPGYEGALLARILAEKKQILIASGSACSAESSSTSHVLKAMGVDKNIARCQLRVSMGYSTSKEDIEALLRALPEALKEF